MDMGNEASGNQGENQIKKQIKIATNLKRKSKKRK